MSLKTITSLAILKVNWDKNQKDYIENYVPFIVHLIKTIGYSKIDVNKIRNDFEIEYGINLPYHPAITILNRVRQKGYIKKNFNSFIPINEKIIEDDFADISNKQYRKIDLILNKFIEYVKKEKRITIDEDQAEKTLISFLKSHDLDTLFASQENSLLPQLEVTKSNKYLFSQFIRYLYENNDDFFQIIVDISIGHILANTILYEEFNKYLSKLDGNKYYFDLPILLELIGICDEIRQEIYEDFMNILRDFGIKLFVFRHTYEELMNNLENCLTWIDNPLYDAEKASKTLNYFIVNGYSSSEIENFIVRVQIVFDKFEIKIVDKPDYSTYKNFQIDEIELKSKIICLYKKTDPSFDEIEKDLMLQNDVDSISSIYRLRGWKRPKSFEEANHIFITKNSTLAYASSQFEKDNFDNSKGFAISACLTDTFIGTLIWLKSPTKINDINRKKLIADAFAALQPDNKLIRRYLNEINKLKEKKGISNEEYYLLRSHRAAINMLNEKTLGDPSNFTDKTPEEILDELKKKCKNEANSMYIDEKEKHKETKEKLISLENGIYDEKEKHKETKEKLISLENGINKNIESISDKISNILSWIIFNSILIIFIIFLIKNYFPNFKYYRFCINPLIFICILTVLNIGFGFNLIGLKKFIRRKSKNLFTKFLSKYLLIVR